MGLECYLVRPDNKTLFALGKSQTGFSEVFKECKRDVGLNGKIDAIKVSLDNLAERLLSAAKEFGCWSENYLNLKEMDRIAKKIIDWVDNSPIAFVYESHAESLRWDFGFKITADRYQNKKL